MSCVFDILGLTHVVVTSVTQSIGALKVQVDAYRSLTPLLVLAEEKTVRIKESISSLQDFAEVSTLESEFFRRTLSSVQDVQHELVSIQSEMENNSSTARFIFASRLRERLVGINETLHETDRSLSAVGMIGDIVARKVREECLNLREGMNMGFNELISMINRALKSGSPAIATESILDSMRQKDGVSFDASSHFRPVFDLLCSEKEDHLYFAIGRSHYDGDRDGNKEFARAARYLHAAFEQGYTPAAFYLGNLYYYGNGVDLSYISSYGYYTVGARSGDARAMACLAWMHAFGCGVEVNSRLAVKWSDAAAKLGNGSGLFHAGQYALHGNATRQNVSKAVRYLKAALKAGEAIAGEQLGQCYANGIVVDRDLHMSSKLMREAYEKTHSETSTFWYANFLQETEQDYVEAANLFKDVANRRTPLGRNYSCYYGLCLIRGLRVTQDISAGVRIVRRSARPGWASGYYVLGEMYKNGYGVGQDMCKAAHYYSKAVSCIAGVHGISSSNKALAELYEIGRGVEQNWTKAAHHYVRAANRMDPLAQWKAGGLFEKGIGVDTDLRRAFVFFDSSARSGHVLAQRKAGELYMRGKGVERDRSQAIRFLEEAAQRGDAGALKLLRRARRQNLLRWRRIQTD